MKIRQAALAGVIASLMIALLIQPSKSADQNKVNGLDDFQRTVKETVASKKLPKQVSVGTEEAYYGMVRMFAVGNQNTFTFWVYATNPAGDYKAYTFSMSDPGGETMRKAVMYAVKQKVTVGVFADESGRPTWIVVYP